MAMGRRMRAIETEHLWFHNFLFEEIIQFAFLCLSFLWILMHISMGKTVSITLFRTETIKLKCKLRHTPIAIH